MIQFLHSGLQGAPSNIITAGSICSILDDCLVNGFNALAPISVSVSSGVATLSYAVPHGYTADQQLRTAGASVAQVNGDRRPTIVSPTVLTLATPGAPDGAVGGSVQTRFAPLGWATAFTDTNVRVYRSPNVEGARMFFRLQDTVANSFSSAFRGYGSMTDANTGLNPFPTLGQQGGAGLPFYKSNSTTPRPWVLVGDDRTFYLALTDSTAQALYPFCVGDINSGRPVDAYAAVLTHPNGSSATDRLAGLGASTHYLARSHDQVTVSAAGTSFAPFGRESGVTGVFPSAASGGVTLAGPVHLAEGNTLRGSFRGLLHLWEPAPAWPFVVLSGLEGIQGRVLLLTCGGTGKIAFPLDVPW